MTCADHAQKIADFVATHRSCSRDDDCVIVGDCSHADFQSVSRSAQAEAQALVTGNPCGAVDGPTYNAVCRAGVCERERSTGACGQAPQVDCPAGTERRTPGCGTPTPSFAEGCYGSCTAGSDAACAPGYTCQQTGVNPCVGLACQACGMQTDLCLPAPACELELSIAFDAVRTVGRLGPNQPSTQLELYLTNRTDRPLTIRYDRWCHGPAVTGFGTYDLWGSCLAGACLPRAERDKVELTLAPREKLLFHYGVVISTTGSACNRDGIAAGTYTPSFSLPGLEGAVACGPAATELRVARP